MSRRVPRGPRTKRGGGKGRTSKWAKAEFIGWDGEGATIQGRHEYVLLANSLGDSIQNPKGLSTDACLRFLLETSAAHPHAIHVGFGFGYDVNMMLKAATYRQLQSVWANQERYGTKIRGYRVRYVPRKTFGVTRFRDPPFILKTGKYVPHCDRIQIWDVFGFFQASFVTAVTDWLGADYPELPLIQAGKARRGSFRPEELASVILPYTQAELRALVRLMQALHAALADAGIPLSRWDGAGAVAAALLRRENIKAFRSSDLPAPLSDAVQRAYFGGRIELFQYGRYDGPVYHADLRSAYPSAMGDLPDLSHGDWRLTTGGPRQPFSVSRVRWDFRGGNRDREQGLARQQETEAAREEIRAYQATRKRLWGAIRDAGFIRPHRDWPEIPPSLLRYQSRSGLDGIARDLGYPDEETLYEAILRYRTPKPLPGRPTETPHASRSGAVIGPLPWRFPEGVSVYFPQAGEGWYWEPEVAAAEEQARRHPGYQLSVVETWNFYPDTDLRPFAFVPALYATRQRWKQEGRAAEKVLKLGLNSLYGKLVQQAGYDPATHRTPPYHELAWGGYITSLTRARLYTLAMVDESHALMIATDGLFSTRPLPVSDTPELGGWELATHAGITIAQSGVYWHPDGSYSRGFEKPDSPRSALSENAVRQGWREGRTFLHFASVRFIGMGSAIQSPASFPRWRQWLDVGEWDRAHGKPDTPLGRELGLTMAGTKRRDVDPWWLHPRDGTPADRLQPTMPNYPLWEALSAPYPLAWARQEEAVDGVSLSVFLSEKGDSDT
jgi:hypothetical protein